MHDLTPSFDSPLVCGLCLRGWGSRIVTPPEGHFRLRNKRTGTYHALGFRGTSTACGKRRTEEYVDVLA